MGDPTLVARDPIFSSGNYRNHGWVTGAPKEALARTLALGGVMRVDWV